MFPILSIASGLDVCGSGVVSDFHRTNALTTFYLTRANMWCYLICVYLYTYSHCVQIKVFGKFKVNLAVAVHVRYITRVQP